MVRIYIYDKNFNRKNAAYDIYATKFDCSYGIESLGGSNEMSFTIPAQYLQYVAINDIVMYEDSIFAGRVTKIDIDVIKREVLVYGVSLYGNLKHYPATMHRMYYLPFHSLMFTNLHSMTAASAWSFFVSKIHPMLDEVFSLFQGNASWYFSRDDIPYDFIFDSSLKSTAAYYQGVVIPADLDLIDPDYDKLAPKMYYFTSEGGWYEDEIPSWYDRSKIILEAMMVNKFEETPTDKDLLYFFDKRIGCDMLNGTHADKNPRRPINLVFEIKDGKFTMTLKKADYKYLTTAQLESDFMTKRDNKVWVTKELLPTTAFCDSPSGAAAGAVERDTEGVYHYYVPYFDWIAGDGTYYDFVVDHNPTHPRRIRDITEKGFNSYMVSTPRVEDSYEACSKVEEKLQEVTNYEGKDIRTQITVTLDEDKYELGDVVIIRSPEFAYQERGLVVGKTMTALSGKPKVTYKMIGYSGELDGGVE